MFHMPEVISDARKADASRHHLQEVVVQGALKQEGLPALDNVLRGEVGKSPFPHPGGMKGKEHPAVLPIAASEVPKTHQKLGSQRYAASQKRR